MLLALFLACTAPISLTPDARADSCGSISNSDLRYLCQSGKRYPGTR
jgi:hypothetical protein